MMARIAKIDGSSWIVCGKCGHKLGKVLDGHQNNYSISIEIKCHSCKEFNTFEGNDKQQSGYGSEWLK